MRANGRRQRLSKDERGFISLDFVFALSIAIGFSLVFFVISYTLAMVEVSQYITFAASRAYAGAHLNEQAQQENGLRKFNQLMSRPVFRTIYSEEMNWIKLGPPSFGDFAELYAAPEGREFVGARVPFEAKILKLQLPFLGPTIQDAQVGKATLNSYLLREVTTQECIENFNQNRWSAIKRLHPVYATAGSATAALITDNGC